MAVEIEELIDKKKSLEAQMEIIDELITNKENFEDLKEDEQKKVGRKPLNDKGLKADKRVTFLLNTYQIDKMEERMRELGIRNKTDYIFKLLKQDIADL